jgi:hypothetical protein
MIPLCLQDQYTKSSTEKHGVVRIPGRRKRAGSCRQTIHGIHVPFDNLSSRCVATIGHDPRTACHARRARRARNAAPRRKTGEV